MGLLRAGVILAAAFCAAAIAEDTPKPSLKLINSVVQVVPGKDDAGTADLLVQAADFSKTELGTNPPKVEDLRVPATPAVQIQTPQFVRELSRSETGAIWLYKLIVSGLPTQSSIPRKMLLALGTVQFPVDYTLTDKASATFAWSFLAPPVWNFVDSPLAEIPVIVKDVPATGIRLLQSTLTRQGGLAVTVGTQNLQLCATQEAACQAPGTIGPSDSRTLFVRMNDVPNGTYSGNIVIRCDQKPEGDTVAVTANVTTGAAQWEGAIAIALGVILYFVVTVLARWRMANNSRRELALLLLRQVEEVKRDSMKVVGAAPDWAKTKTAAAFQDLESRLSVEKLHPVMSGPLNPDAKIDEFKAHLQGVGLRLEALRVVIQMGMSKIAQAWGVAGTDTVKQAAVTKAVDELLATPDGQITAADAKTKVAAILTEMDTALGTAHAAGLGHDDVGMQLQHVWISTLEWTWVVFGVWAVATILTGVMAMVWGKAGFGTETDFGLCLLWGLGFPAAGTQLNQLSSTGIGSKLGITLPKAEG